MFRNAFKDISQKEKFKTNVCTQRPHGSVVNSWLYWKTLVCALWRRVNLAVTLHWAGSRCVFVAPPPRSCHTVKTKTGTEQIHNVSYISQQTSSVTRAYHRLAQPNHNMTACTRRSKHGHEHAHPANNSVFTSPYCGSAIRTT